MATPPEGPVLDKPRDTALEEAPFERTVTPGAVSSHGFSGPSRPRELQIGTMVGEYRIEGLLGEGGMGRVYSAIHPVIGKQAAVKVLHPRMSANPEVVDRFIQEARAVNQIGHDNIVDIFSFGELPDGQHYFVMEWLRGESLYERIQRQPLALAELCTFVIDITHALEAAHDKGIIHRDLKPENVFLQQVKHGLQIKLLDFGIAKLTNGEDTRLERTHTGAMMGTPKYIAPEQARGYAVDARVDIYSLGVMLFELTTGRLPFEADNAMDLVASHLHEAPPRMSAVSRDVPWVLDELVAAMLAKSPEGRPSLARVREVLAEVRALPPGAGVTLATPASPAVSVLGAPRQRRSRGLLIAGIAGVGVLAGVIAITVLGDRAVEAPVAEQAPEQKPKDGTVVEAKATPVPDTKPPVAPAPKPPVAPAPKPVPPTAVTVTTRVAKSTLLVDGTLVEGSSPWVLELVPGPHALVLRPARGALVTRTLDVGTEPLAIELAPPVRSTGGSKPPTTKPITVKPPTTTPKPPVAGDDDFLEPTKR